MVSSCLYAADEEFPYISWCIYGLSLVYIRIVSVINVRVSIYSVVFQYFIYYVIIMITYLLCVC
jgi:hypothetical protein